MAPLHSLGQDNRNEVQYDIFFVHVMLLVSASASCNTNGIDNGAIALLCKDNGKDMQHHATCNITIYIM